ncbi:unnamed protein product [Amoebophrya sp. A25]|nr:unnamed protein product [Amoebophrya sp. A25]|eukprot:GSA25T00008653001.1
MGRMPQGRCRMTMMGGSTRCAIQGIVGAWTRKTALLGFVSYLILLLLHGASSLVLHKAEERKWIIPVAHDVAAQRALKDLAEVVRSQKIEKKIESGLKNCFQLPNEGGEAIFLEGTKTKMGTVGDLSGIAVIRDQLVVTSDTDDLWFVQLPTTFRGPMPGMTKTAIPFAGTVRKDTTFVEKARKSASGMPLAFSGVAAEHGQFHNWTMVEAPPTRSSAFVPALGGGGTAGAALGGGGADTTAAPDTSSTEQEDTTTAPASSSTSGDGGNNSTTNANASFLFLEHGGENVAKESQSSRGALSSFFSFFSSSGSDTSKAKQLFSREPSTPTSLSKKDAIVRQLQGMRRGEEAITKFEDIPLPLKHLSVTPHGVRAMDFRVLLKGESPSGEYGTVEFRTGLGDYGGSPAALEAMLTGGTNASDQVPNTTVERAVDFFNTGTSIIGGDGGSGSAALLLLGQDTNATTTAPGAGIATPVVAAAPAGDATAAAASGDATPAPSAAPSSGAGDGPASSAAGTSATASANIAATTSAPSGAIVPASSAASSRTSSSAAPVRPAAAEPKIRNYIGARGEFQRYDCCVWLAAKNGMKTLLYDIDSREIRESLTLHNGIGWVEENGLEAIALGSRQRVYAGARIGVVREYGFTAKEQAKDPDEAEASLLYTKGRLLAGKEINMLDTKSTVIASSSSTASLNATAKAVSAAALKKPRGVFVREWSPPNQFWGSRWSKHRDINYNTKKTGEIFETGIPDALALRKGSVERTPEELAAMFAAQEALNASNGTNDTSNVTEEEPKEVMPGITVEQAVSATAEAVSAAASTIVNDGVIPAAKGTVEGSAMAANYTVNQVILPLANKTMETLNNVVAPAINNTLQGVVDVVAPAINNTLQTLSNVEGVVVPVVRNTVTPVLNTTYQAVSKAVQQASDTVNNAISKVVLLQEQRGRGRRSTGDDDDDGDKKEEERPSPAVKAAMQVFNQGSKLSMFDSEATQTPSVTGMSYVDGYLFVHVLPRKKNDDSQLHVYKVDVDQRKERVMALIEDVYPDFLLANSTYVLHFPLPAFKEQIQKVKFAPLAKTLGMEEKQKKQPVLKTEIGATVSNYGTDITARKTAMGSKIQADPTKIKKYVVSPKAQPSLSGTILLPTSTTSTTTTITTTSTTTTEDPSASWVLPAGANSSNATATTSSCNQQCQH